MVVSGGGRTGEPDPDVPSRHWVGIEHSGFMGTVRKDTRVLLSPASRGCGSQEAKPWAELQRLELKGKKGSEL